MYRRKRNFEKEYDYLREEIMHHKQRQNTYSTFVCTALITVLGGAAITKIQWISLLGFLIILPSAMKAFESRYSISLLAAYMKTYLEPYAGIQWESNLLQYYDDFRRSESEQIVYRFSKYDYVLYSIGTSVFYWLILYHKIKTYLVDKGKTHDFSSVFTNINHFHNWAILLIQLLFIVIIAVFTYRFYDYKRLKESTLLKWRDLQHRQIELESEHNPKLQIAVIIQSKKSKQENENTKHHG